MDELIFSQDMGDKQALKNYLDIIPRFGCFLRKEAPYHVMSEALDFGGGITRYVVRDIEGGEGFYSDDLGLDMSLYDQNVFVSVDGEESSLAKILARGTSGNTNYELGFTKGILPDRFKNIYLERGMNAGQELEFGHIYLAFNSNLDKTDLDKFWTPKGYSVEPVRRSIAIMSGEETIALYAKSRVKIIRGFQDQFARDMPDNISLK